jgi:hypothetical protein
VVGLVCSGAGLEQAGPTIPFVPPERADGMKLGISGAMGPASVDECTFIEILGLGCDVVQVVDEHVHRLSENLGTILAAQRARRRKLCPS